MTSVQHSNKIRPLELYRLLLGARLAEQKIVELSNARELPAHHSGLNHEAIGIGVGLAVEFDDCVQSSYRSGASLMHARQGGLALRDLIQQAYGLIPGPRAQHPGGPRMLRSTGIVGGQIPMAVGVAMAFKLRGSKNVVVSFIGDGASNEGAVHEAMNIAGVKKVPIVFIIENNGMALSTRRSDSTAAVRLADRGPGYGIKAAEVDGRDPNAVYEAMSEALERAREQSEPAIVEMRISRTGPHVTVIRDVRDEHELEVARANDCVNFYRDHLFAAGELDEAGEAAMAAELADIVESAVVEARRMKTERVQGGATSAVHVRYAEAEAWRLAYATRAPAHFGA